MKRIMMIIYVLLQCNMYSQVQKAEKIIGYANKSMPMSYYKEQIKAWRNLIDENPADENAWLNYYAAKRLLIYHDESDKRSGNEKDADLHAIISEMKKNIPNSYTYNFCEWQVRGNDMKYVHFLKKAISIDPQRQEHTDYMINIGELERNMQQRDEYSLRKIEIGQMSTGMMYYNYNTLIGLEKNAILITSGDNDTYPAWALQAKGIRKDVTVLNLYLLHIQDYREKVFAELSIPNVELSEEDQKDFFNKKLLNHLYQNKKNYPVYTALTAASCNNDLESVEQNLYLIGLAYKFDTASFDNIACLKKNIEQQYAFDYLDKSFYNEMSVENVNSINENYLLPLLKLYQHYKASGELQKQQWLKEKIILISKGRESAKYVEEYIN